MNLKIQQHKFFFGCLLLAFAFSSCNSAPAEGILSEEQMESIMLDLYIYEGITDTREIPDSIRPHIYNSILQKYGITQAEYDSSMFFYGKDLAHFIEMHERVISSLETMKKEFESDLQTTISPEKK